MPRPIPTRSPVHPVRGRPLGRSLAHKFGGIAGVNSRYRTRFKALDVVPMPLNEEDPAFGDAAAAYFDFVSTINAWVVRQIDECRALWRERAQRPVPFMCSSPVRAGEVRKGPRRLCGSRHLRLDDTGRRAGPIGLHQLRVPGLGHASVVAMVDFLRLGPLLGVPVWVLEGGSECNGAVLNRDELRFFAMVAAPLRPASVIYEFLKMSYAERFSTSAGKMMSVAGVPRHRRSPRFARHCRRRRLRRRSARRRTSSTILRPAEDAELLAARKRLARLAVTRPLAFVPPRRSRRSAGTTLVVCRAPRSLCAERLAHAV